MSIARLDLRSPEEGDIRYKHFIFKSGENHFQVLNIPKGVTDVEILLQYRCDGQLIKLLQVVDALNRYGKRVNGQSYNLHLKIPYFPGGRQDRVCNDGESLSVKVYANLINSQGFKTVHIFDPHSEVTPALINNCVSHNNYRFVDRVIVEILTNELKVNSFFLSIPQNVVLVSPDAGSNKKIFGVSSFLGGVDVIRADKIRDVKNGNIIGTEVFAGDLTGKICLIVDDICAGGRTFIELAKKLKEKGADKIYLIVSHDEGVVDTNKLKEAGINKMYCTNSKHGTNDDFRLQFDVFGLM